MDWKTRLGWLLMAGSALAQDEMAHGMPAAEAAGHMKVPAGFAVDLVASEPEIVQPIAMCFDARGRIWLAEGMTYPTRAPEGEGKDRILILEDADGDGSFETRKVFAEGLNLVSGIETGFGGVYVGAAPYFMFLADKDGDDKADGAPEILLDGWGYHDTHETLNSFIWGPDGWLYGCHGVFTHSRVGKPGTPDEQRVPINAGIWRFHPVTRQFEVFAWGTSNPWGLDFNDRGEAFCEACVIPHLWHIIPGGYYQRQAGSHFNPHIYEPLETIADHRHWVGNIGDHAHWGHENAISKGVSDAGGGHAHCGFAMCLSDSFPADFRDSALFFNIHGHRLNRDLVERKGSGWTGKHAPDVMLSMDQWFLGVAIEPGPDGALYFTDWHDDTSCHRPDPQRWDRSNGRLFRLRHGDLKPWAGDLTKAGDLDLAKLQAGRDEWQLRTARRLLQERVASGAKLDPAAIAFLGHTMRNHPDETRRLRAMWCLAVCGELKGGLFDDPSEWLRAWSVRLDPAGAVALAAKEESPVVLLSLCSALQKLPDDAAWQVADAIAPKMVADDANLTKLFWFGFERLVPGNEERAVKIAHTSPDGRLLNWTARRLGSADALLTGYTNGDLTRASLLEALRVRMEIRPDERLDERGISMVSSFKDGADPAIAAKVDDLLTRNGDREATGKLWATLEDRGVAAPRRKKALKLLAPHLKDSDQGRLARLMDDPALRLPVLLVWPRLLDEGATKDRVAGFTPEEKTEVSRLAAREGKVALLLEWLGAKKLLDRDVPPDAVASLREVRDPSLHKEIVARWGELSADQAGRRALIAGWKAKLTPEVLAKADTANGKLIFGRTCAACHKLFGEGGEIGPELTGGERGSLDHWLDNIIDPNALVGVGYELHQIEKKDGSTVIGMLAAENDEELILRMVGVETKVPKREVKENKALGKSMMPEGMINGLSDDEVRDLIGYLMGPGK
ncbi:PVC-type heme-binding CxxCH protein [Luteolibacter marinus]|uniref:PVC-type heme-binding CxxCH protein n=1 Tax=Luteolibacter marinus TaxID=2776705 RepID=UPI001865CBE4|nr:PVC-type heme-binding CxxCH protein [Luteolibacter marinus]